MSCKKKADIWIAADGDGDTLGPSCSFLSEKVCQGHAARFMRIAWKKLSRQGWTVKTGTLTISTKEPTP